MKTCLKCNRAFAYLTTKLRICTKCKEINRKIRVTESTGPGPRRAGVSGADKE